MIAEFIVGFIYGLIIALLGALKDTRYENFNIIKFIRSPLITAIWAVILGYALPGLPLYIIGLSAIALERITVEIYKGIRSLEGKYKPGKFDYPMNEYAWYELTRFVPVLLLLYGALLLVPKHIGLLSPS